MKNFMFYDCNLEGRQLEIGESGFLPASEVVCHIFDAGFRKYGLNTFDSGTNALFACKYVMKPKDGMFLMEVRNHHGDIAKLVFIDTRTKPNFVWVQPADNGEDDEWSLQVAHFVEDWISREAYAYGWKAKLKRSVFNKLVYWPQFDSAMAYIDEYLERIPAFCTFVKDTKKVGNVMEVLHQKLDHKNKAILMMKVLRAAYDADLIEKPEFESFIREFKKEGKICLSSFNHYMMDDNPLADDKDYQRYLHDFVELKRKYASES
jgi:hypothetical protein